MYYIGVDLGGTNIAIGIVNSNLEIIDKGSVPTNANRAGELIVKDMANLSESLLKKNGIALSDVALGKMILDRAEAQGVGTVLTLMEESDIIR